MSRVPIRVRVAAAFALAMAVVLAGTGWFLYARLGSHLALALDRELRLRAQDLAALVRERDGSLAAAGGGRLVERGESYAQLLDADGHVVDGTRPLGRVSLLTVGELRNAREETFFSDRRSVPGLDEPSRLLATPIERRGRRLVLIVGATRQDRAETLASLRDELLIAGPLALALASLAGYFLAGLSLRPVESMRRRAATISAETPGERLPVPATRDELERLGDTLNAMLARLDAALQRERDFVADAGHELRTPLALLRTELELALRHGETIEELRDAVRRSSQEVDRLAQLAEDLLLTARAESGRVPLQRETLDVTELLAAVATRFSWRAEEAGRQITVEATAIGSGSSRRSETSPTTRSATATGRSRSAQGASREQSSSRSATRAQGFPETSSAAPSSASLGPRTHERPPSQGSASPSSSRSPKPTAAACRSPTPPKAPSRSS